MSVTFNSLQNNSEPLNPAHPARKSCKWRIQTLNILQQQVRRKETLLLISNNTLFFHIFQYERANETTKVDVWHFDELTKFWTTGPHIQQERKF